MNGDEAEVVQKQIQTVIENRTYEKSPNGLAYWGQANNKLILKLNIPAIITEIIKNSQQQIDGELINVVVYNDPQKSNLVAGFVLRCFQHLSDPDLDTRQCTWQIGRASCRERV